MLGLLTVSRFGYGIKLKVVNYKSMKYTVNTTGKIPVKMWVDEIEAGAVDQINNLSNLPFAFKHIAIMPDCHQGYGMPIGGVLATKGVIIPNAVGVDIGCGMCATKTSLTEINKEDLTKIVDSIRKVIPVGFSHQAKVQYSSLMPLNANIDVVPIVCQEFNSALKQIGTLGGGNHFIEIQKGSDGFIWIMIHSGSRNIGLKIAQYYNKIALSLNEQWYSKIEKSMDLAFLPMETQYAKDYKNEMDYCVEFALANRKLMMNRILNIFYNHFKGQVVFDEIRNIAHNYARYEHHFGQDVIIHRKGATSAKLGEIGIIPGSMGTKSYIVEGLGNPESFMSCSHGAGRKMGRKQAQRELNLESEIKIMNDQGIIHNMKTTENLDEASGAYKDIDIVMTNQSDLVKILVELHPLAVIKG